MFRARGFAARDPEIGIGRRELTVQVRKLGFLALGGLSEGSVSHGRAWCLEDLSVQEHILWLLCEKVMPRSALEGWQRAQQC